MLFLLISISWWILPTVVVIVMFSQELVIFCVLCLHLLTGILCEEELCLLSHLFIYLIISVTSVCDVGCLFGEYIEVCCYLFCGINYSSLAVGCLSSWLLFPLTCSHPFLCLSLIFRHHKILILYFHLPSPGINHFCKDSWFHFFCRSGIEKSNFGHQIKFISKLV